MAKAPHHRRALLEAVDAAASRNTASGHAAFGRRLARLARHMALREATQTFGPMIEADEAFDHLRAALVAKHGSIELVRDDPDDAAALAAALKRSNDAIDANWALYGVPADRAAELVAMTPAPTIADVLLKIDIVAEFELDDQLASPALTIIQEDLRRLARAA